MSIFLQQNHLILRNPAGGVEDVAAMRDAGFRIILCNVGDHEPPEWDLVRERAAQAGVVVGPWLRTAKGSGQSEFDVAKFTRLLDVADEWDGPPMVNSEKEIDHTGDDITGWMAPMLEGYDAAISSEVRPYQAVDWTPLAKYPILPQNFPAENLIDDSDDEIRRRWREVGMNCVVITYGAYAGMEADDFDRLTPFGAYAADDMGGVYAPWTPLGSVNPCKDEEDPVAQPLPPLAADDCKKLETKHMKRDDGKDATCFNDRAASLKAMRERILQLEDRIIALEK